MRVRLTHSLGVGRRKATRRLRSWFTCQRCHSRWERKPLRQNVNEELNDEDRLDFGKNVGKTYSEIFLSQVSYCDWVVDTSVTGDSPGPQLLRFARYILAKREARIAQTQGAQVHSEEVPDPNEILYPVAWDEQMIGPLSDDSLL